MELKTKKIVFADLDGTLIETLTGETFPKGVWDMKLKFEVFSKIKECFPNITHLMIVSNQGGIAKGLIDPYNFKLKMEWIMASILEYIGNEKLKVFGTCCPWLEGENPYRKPNTGMLTKLLGDTEFEVLPSKEDMIMIGDASDIERDFSDSDKKTAENFGIDYIDVRDLLKYEE